MNESNPIIDAIKGTFLPQRPTGEILDLALTYIASTGGTFSGPRYLYMPHGVDCFELGRAEYEAMLGVLNHGRLLAVGLELEE